VSGLAGEGHVGPRPQRFGRWRRIITSSRTWARCATPVSGHLSSRREGRTRPCRPRPCVGPRPIATPASARAGPGDMAVSHGPSSRREAPSAASPAKAMSRDPRPIATPAGGHARPAIGRPRVARRAAGKAVRGLDRARALSARSDRRRPPAPSPGPANQHAKRFHKVFARLAAPIIDSTVKFTSPAWSNSRPMSQSKRPDFHAQCKL
jgi:hypothetical protein